MGLHTVHVLDGRARIPGIETLEKVPAVACQHLPVVRAWLLGGCRLRLAPGPAAQPEVGQHVVQRRWSVPLFDGQHIPRESTIFRALLAADELTRRIYNHQHEHPSTERAIQWRWHRQLRIRRYRHGHGDLVRAEHALRNCVPVGTFVPARIRRHPQCTVYGKPGELTRIVNHWQSETNGKARTVQARGRTTSCSASDAPTMVTVPHRARGEARVSIPMNACLSMAECTRRRFSCHETRRSITRHTYVLCGTLHSRAWREWRGLRAT